MEEKLKMVPWATNERKNRFVIFMIDRGRNKPNAFVWVTPDSTGEDAVDITTFGDVISYFTQTARPMYFGEDRPEELMNAAIETLNEVPDEYIDGLIGEFKIRAHNREQNKEQVEFEKECLEAFARDAKEGDGLSAV